MFRTLTFLALALGILTSSAAVKYTYDTVPGDPMKAKIYTLPNGLKVYMSVNKDRPRIQTNIAVRVGGKNDPAETTGLAHYFEHLMFKGTPYFGTSDYEAEKPLLDEIERLFEVYRVTTDPEERTAIYHLIDSVSYEASKIAIPNEYDKLMSAIGSEGTNAYTGTDMTCYVENIPANQLDNWARIQAMRFKYPVLRGFHTELETIYEEKNMSLTSDGRKTYEKLLEIMFPHHPYGTQTVLGTQEHLKNPSITNVKNYHKKWYVPNNMAIVLSGDFDPDVAVETITKYFGDMEPNPDLAMLTFEPEKPITSPIEAEVTGLESEYLMLGWRFPGASSLTTDTLNIIDNLLSNGKAGLIDIDINQAQTMLGAGSGVLDMTDYSMFVLQGMPKGGQTLEEVRDLLLAEVDKLRKGDFDESLLNAIINNFKLYEQNGLESNRTRMNTMATSFINNTPWEQQVGALARQENLTKEDIMRFARENLGDNNYAIVYKRQGNDTTIIKMPKPDLTPIETNRDAASDFLVEIQNSEVEPIEPVFIDFSRDLDILAAKKDIPVYYKKNDTNDTFSLIYVFETGSNADRMLDTGADLLDLLDIPGMTAAEIQSKFYELACTYNVSIGAQRSYILLSGLSENMEEAMKLMERVIAEAIPDTEVYSEYAGRVLKSRDDAKNDEDQAIGALYNYAFYGPEKVAWQLTNDEIKNTDPALFVDAVKNMRNYPHRIIYYGPMESMELLAAIDGNHYTPDEFAPLPELRKFNPLPTPENRIYLAPYDSNQIKMYMLSNRDDRFDPSTELQRRMYNNYFNGDMSSIVFQEMRESRSLAYSASAGMSGTSRLDAPIVYIAYIATQNDKMMDAINAFDEIINEMPRSENAFRLAKDGYESSLRTARTIKDGVAWALINTQDLGLDEPFNKQAFEGLPSITLDTVADYQQNNVKGRTYSYCILGRIEDLDLDALREIGEVIILTPEQTFGF